MYGPASRLAANCVMRRSLEDSEAPGRRTHGMGTGALIFARLHSPRHHENGSVPPLLSLHTRISTGYRGRHWVRASRICPPPAVEWAERWPWCTATSSIMINVQCSGTPSRASLYSLFMTQNKRRVILSHYSPARPVDYASQSAKELISRFEHVGSETLSTK